VFAVALGVRLVLLACVAPALRVSEFADDTLYYRVLIRQPSMLLTGHIVKDMEGGVIYAPFMPYGIAFPGRFFADAFGFSVGHRLGMIVYDVLAVTLALGIAWRLSSPPKGVKDWLIAFAFTVVPGSALASAIWGQEDTLAATWGALCLLAITSRRPVLAAGLAALGVFTIKMFAVLVVFGIWLGTPDRRRAIAVAGIIPVLLLMGFSLARWYLTGLVTPTPTYGALGNSPSFYSAFYYAFGPVTFAQVRLSVMIITTLGMALLTWRSFRTPPDAVAAIVSAHAMFFLTFIGIQPEHHQWFMPFLLVLAWSAFRAGEVALPVTAWVFSAFAYAYKIAFGLQGGASAAATGKNVFRAWIAQHVHGSLFPIQMLMLALTLSAAATLCVLSFRFGVRQHRLLLERAVA
jgi:hypothetical protein